MMQKREARSSGAICIVMTTAYYMQRLKLYTKFICDILLGLWYLLQNASDRCHDHEEPKTTPALPAWPLILSIYKTVRIIEHF